MTNHERQKQHKRDKIKENKHGQSLYHILRHLPRHHFSLSFLPSSLLNTACCRPSCSGHHRYPPCLRCRNLPSCCSPGSCCCHQWCLSCRKNKPLINWHRKFLSRQIHLLGETRTRLNILANNNNWLQVMSLWTMPSLPRLQCGATRIRPSWV